MHGYFRLAAYTGARRGELMNLRWADVHLGDDQAGGVRAAAGHGLGHRRGAGRGHTKGGRERTVSIDAGTAAVLTEHRRRQEAERALAAGSWVGGRPRLPRELGEPLFPDTPTALMAKLQRQHNTAAAAAGSPRCR